MMRAILFMTLFLPIGLQAADAPAAESVTPAAQTENPAVDTSASPATENASIPASEPRTPQVISRTNDRLQLDTTVVTGNRELPKVLYIVPWKKADLGDLPGQPFNTLIDEVLTPVDRDVFRREVTYYGAISSRDATSSSEPESRRDGSEK
jgi:hypothetical protein